MGFVIWYAIEFSPDGVLPLLLVSNDVLRGQYALDANITLEMRAGDNADSFSAELVNLPAKVADQLKSLQASSPKPSLFGGPPSAPLHAKVHLGYFDDPATTLLTKSVMHAAVTSVKTEISAGGELVTTVRGLELGGYNLLRSCIKKDQAAQTNLDALVSELCNDAGVTAVAGSALGTVAPYTLNSRNGLEALNRIAAIARAPLVVRDEKVFIGKAVGTETFGTFDPDVNLVSLTRVQEEQRDPDFCRRSEDDAPQSEPRTSVDIKVLGAPDLRVGQNATLKVRDPADALAGTLRVNQVKHVFSTKNGYTCDVTLAVANPGELAEVSRGAHHLIRRLADVGERTLDDRPALDVGEVSSYTAGSDKHVATLKYGQAPKAGSIAPSVEDPVNDKPELHDKPIASPFAWKKCGLIVPVYPGMRALLAHNRSLANDAIIDGFLWPDNPELERPKSVAGDYWLALPTGLEADKPTGKGVNDLTDKSGFRTIDAKGLRFAVGDAKLKDIGERPDPPTDEKLVIEHAKDTTITIAPDGSVEISTKGKPITLKTGDSTSVKIDDSAVTISGLKLKVGP
jgi:hypothetical protein